MDWSHCVIAVAGGALAGAVNTLAGNGSALTLTILTEVLGLPGNLANGTNRLGVLAQSMAGSWAFYRNGKLNLQRSGLYIGLMVVGALVGVWAAVSVTHAQFREVFRFLMVVMLLVILFKPGRWLRETDPDARPGKWWTVPLFLAIGFYGGFIQMGMGIIFLAAMVLGARFSLIEANAAKIFGVALYTLPVLVVFQYRHLVDWEVGAVMAGGQMVGGWLTAHHASKHPRANVWAHRVLVLIVLLSVLKLFGVFDLWFR